MPDRWLAPHHSSGGRQSADAAGGEEHAGVAAEHTVGAEEEFHLIDAATGEISAAGPRVAADRGKVAGTGRVVPEMLSSQVELITPVCRGLGELRIALMRLREELAAIAERHGCRLIASGTYPGRQRPAVTPSPRYEELADQFGMVAREQVVCSCHVHVGVADRDLAIAVMNRARPWLAVLLALSANSPFWKGEDTGYASYRSQIWSQWPSTGTPDVFGSYAEYVARTQRLVDTGVLRDRGMLYWDVRPSEHVSTVEFRMCDVTPDVEQTVMLAGLARALTARCADDEYNQRPLPEATPELLQAARWRAARSGLSGELVDPVTARAQPAAQQVQRLLDYADPALHARGDRDAVTSRVDHLLRWGTAAAQQRQAFRRRHNLHDVLETTTVSPQR